MSDNLLLILHVEDNPDDRQLLLDYMLDVEEDHMEIISCDTLSKALKICRERPVSAVLLDLNLPDSDGYETFDKLYRENNNIPIIVLTMIDLRDLAVKAVRSGAQDYLIKSELSGPLIDRTIRYAVYRKEASVELAKRKDQLEVLVHKRTKDLIESQLLLKLVADNVPAMISFVNNELRYKFVNVPYAQMFGKYRDEVVGDTYRELLSEEDDADMMQRVNMVMSGTKVSFEKEYQLSDNTPIFLFTSYVPYVAHNGLVCGFFSMTMDITERKKSEQELLKKHQLLLDILDGIKAAVLYVDTETFEIVKANVLAGQMIGMPIDELIGNDFRQYICSKPYLYDGYACLTTDDIVENNEFYLLRSDDSIIPIDKTVLPMKIGSQSYFIKILFDITERKNIEQQLAHAVKMESIGQLAAGIAHEINTPAQYINDNLKFINDSISQVVSIINSYKNIFDKTDLKDCLAREYKELKDNIEDIDLDYILAEIPIAVTQSQEGIGRISEIVKAMKRFTHPGQDSKQLVNIHDALESTAIVCRNEWKYHAELKTDFDESMPLVPCFINDINQVFLNVIVNAAHAISHKQSTDHIANKEKGIITLQTKYVDGWAQINIHDNGAGIDPDVLPRIFDPFYTTKEVGKGTGQGLSISYSIIVTKHNGAITITSKKGVGTTCIIRIPVDDSQKTYRSN
ncbi:ATP-binding protein [Maridesulfovibrio zosterae]|uniref:ATP-binding protein n=1 Tax=Maridesulfovibrio zosterae TaxID=82171 RepID=UPI0003FBD0EF|nr:ATP-binding protein [Maridesulfovibrio zosterae]